MKSMQHSPVEQLKDFIRHKHAVPGMYPQYLVMDDGGNLCHACARDNFMLILRATRNRFDLNINSMDDWATVGTDVNWDDTLYCDHCGERIESAYAEPEAAHPLPGHVLVSQTFEIAPPDAESEDDLETGFEFQSRAVTFRELVELMEEHPEPSHSPCHVADAFTWFTSYPEQDYRTGSYRSTSIHFDRQGNPPRKVKYWNLAARAALARRVR